MRIASVAALLLAVACEHADSDVARGQAPADSAAIWIARAQGQPPIASWLYLRAAAETSDSSARSALYSRVSLPVARARIPLVEAAARERFADTLGALRAYRALSAPVTVFRIRASMSRAASDSVRSELVSFIGSQSASSTIRESVALFDRLYRDPSQAEQLVLARASARAGSWSRARAAFAAVPDGELSAADRLSLATALARADSSRRAAQEFAMIDSPPALAGAARYQGALALLNAGDGAGARNALRSLGASGRDTSAAAALSLLADLQTDDGNDSGSRETLLALARRFPTSRFASPARFNAALIALILGNSAIAAREMSALASSGSADALAAEYWLGRAREATRDSAAARTAYREVIHRDSTSYYADLAAARLGTTSMHSVRGSAGFPRVAAVDSALERVALLRKLDMNGEAQLENDWLYREAPSDSGRLLATAAAFSATDQAARGIALGRVALTRVGSTPDVWRLLYPVAARDTIVTEARDAGIDPALVAGLIRQESSFNPRAVSPAGARGLMQLMPSVAATIAPSANIAPWSAAMLYDPGVNIELGVRHLAPLLRGQPNVARSLAAYNAGGSRVARWSGRRGSDDPEMFTERIPFSETRDYVKSVLRNRGFYRALYNW
ncbi:MAG: lytic transglycosylase domain-containing protein [Gemmatimonadota bacterium]|nr:lytic transglycosylase domain-containing protein [Gemmatimonadota bacterium]